MQRPDSGSSSVPTFPVQCTLYPFGIESILVHFLSVWLLPMPHSSGVQRICGAGRAGDSCLRALSSLASKVWVVIDESWGRSLNAVLQLRASFK